MWSLWQWCNKCGPLPMQACKMQRLAPHILSTQLWLEKNQLWVLVLEPHNTCIRSVQCFVSQRNKWPRGIKDAELCSPAICCLLVHLGRLFWKVCHRNLLQRVFHACCHHQKYSWWAPAKGPSRWWCRNYRIPSLQGSPSLTPAFLSFRKCLTIELFVLIYPC